MQNTGAEPSGGVFAWYLITQLSAGTCKGYWVLEETRRGRDLTYILISCLLIVLKPNLKPHIYILACSSGCKYGCCNLQNLYLFREISVFNPYLLKVPETGFSSHIVYLAVCVCSKSPFYASANVVAIGIMFQECSCVCACVDFERKCLWNGWRCRQAVNDIINYNLCCIELNFLVNFGPLTTTVSWLMFTHSLR